jgi:hypothetical protein
MAYTLFSMGFAGEGMRVTFWDYVARGKVAGMSLELRKIEGKSVLTLHYPGMDESGGEDVSSAV